MDDFKPMNSINPYDNDAIERFVLGQMPDEALDAFLAYVALHPEIQAEINVVRERIKTLRGLEQPTPTKPTQKRLWTFLIVLFCIGITTGFWFFWQTPSSPEAIPSPTQTSPPPAIPQQQPIAQTPQTLDNPKVEKPKSLAAAYRPNKFLDMQMSNQVRSDGLACQILEPALDQVLSRQSGQVDFQLSGILKTEEVVSGRTFRVLIFDNQQASVEGMRYLAAFELPLTTNKNGVHEFRLLKKTSLKPGLFYYIIEDSNGDWHHVGRFRVG